MEREPLDSAAMVYNPRHRFKLQKLSFHCYGKHSRRGVDKLASLGRKLLTGPCLLSPCARTCSGAPQTLCCASNKVAHGSLGMGRSGSPYGETTEGTAWCVRGSRKLNAYKDFCYNSAI